MGRYNNKRTQAAAEAMKNTPSRARFSKGPPNKSKKRTTRNDNGNGKSNGNEGGNRHGPGKTTSNKKITTHAGVISKITSRVQQQSQVPRRSTKTTAPILTQVDKSKYDKLALPQDVLNRIDLLLKQLGIKQGDHGIHVANPTRANKSPTKFASDNADDNADISSSRYQSPVAGGMELSTGAVITTDAEQHPPKNSETSKTSQSANYFEYEDDDDCAEDLVLSSTSISQFPSRIAKHAPMTSEIEAEPRYDYDYGYSDVMSAEWEGTPASELGDDKTRMNNQSRNEEAVFEANEAVSAHDEENYEDVGETKTFQYLTQHLSFTNLAAATACRAIQDWEANLNSENTKQDSNLALAMDWLCLHLTESELVAGFLPNPNRNTATNTSNNVSLSGVPLVGSNLIKAVPHSAISVAKPITSDREWSRAIRQQQQTVTMIRLGFSASEAGAGAKVEDNDSVIWDAPSLMSEFKVGAQAFIQALLVLTKDAVDGSSSLQETQDLTVADLEYASEERNLEREAMEAIYDRELQVVGGISEDDLGEGQDYYILSITPNENLREPGRSGDCRLFVLPTKGYPVVQPPLLFFTNPSLPPSLLRRVQIELARKAQANLGEAIIFELVTFLSDSLARWQLDFTKEQRKKEFDAEQARLRKYADEQGASLERVIDAQYENEGKLGRRQRAKLRAAEKAFDRSGQLEQEELARQQRQQERVDRARHENQHIRAAFAEEAILKREQERIEAEAKQAARAAMNKAFNDGATVEEARAAADHAQAESLMGNGVIPSKADEDSEKKIACDGNEIGNGDPAASSTPTTDGATAKTIAFMERLNPKNVQVASDRTDNATDTVTPTTMAFMDRLREMYDSAAKQRQGQKGDEGGEKKGRDPKNELAGYHLSRPEVEGPTQIIGTLQRMPRPVAVPTGELGDIMADVISLQKDQPWLISTEARAPNAGVDSVANRTLPATNCQQDISNKLQRELERKRRLADEWAAAQPTDPDCVTRKRSGNGNGAFSPMKFHEMMTARKRLPAFRMEREIVKTIGMNQVTVIAGDTGCGKTTQVPQLVLDDLIMNGQGAATNIIVTQPRRISAIGVSERIADERCEKVGETCGYSIKLEKKMSTRTRLLLCTTGILLRRLQCDPDLASVSHIFVDEVHERDLNTDFLIIILKDLLARRRGLKLVLMSATLNSKQFSDYFGVCPVVSIPGRAHPVEEHRLEDILEVTKFQIEEGSDYAVKVDPPKISKSALRKLYHPKYSKETIHSLSIVDESNINYELLAALLEHIAVNKEPGAILVFMPGMMEIQKAIEELLKNQFFQGPNVVIYPLHSSLSTDEQTEIFKIPEEGVRKIVISTNIAETSITIEDVVYVVDTGRVKENQRDEINETPALVECWVSRASAKQRRGRAGRVRPGIAYHMYSSHTFQHEMQDYQLPEMLRVGIEDVVLQILVLDLGEPTTFLGKALNPPSDLAMANSLRLLETLGAVENMWGEDPDLREQEKTSYGTGNGSSRGTGKLDVTSELTALGFHLATLPVDPRVGKLMIYGCLFGCIEPALTVAAAMASARSPFVSPFDEREQADQARKRFAAQSPDSMTSDHLTILNAFASWKQLRSKGRSAQHTFLKENYLNRLTLFQMDDLRKQYANLLIDIGFLPKGFRFQSGQPKSAAGDAVDGNSQNLGLVKAVLCAGLYPNIIVAPRSLIGTGKKVQAGECTFRTHRKGDVHLHPSTVAFEQKVLQSRYCCYHKMVKTSKAYVRDCTCISPFALLLFGGSLKVDQFQGICTVDGWLKFQLEAKPATLVKYLRTQMEKVLLEKIVSPEDDVFFGSAEGTALIEAINILFKREWEKLSEAMPQDGSTEIKDGREIVRPWSGQVETEKPAQEISTQRSQHRRGGRGGGQGSSRDGARKGRGVDSNQGRGGRVSRTGGGRRRGMAS